MSFEYLGWTRAESVTKSCFQIQNNSFQSFLLLTLSFRAGQFRSELYGISKPFEEYVLCFDGLISTEVFVIDLTKVSLMKKEEKQSLMSSIPSYSILY